MARRYTYYTSGRRGGWNASGMSREAGTERDQEDPIPTQAFIEAAAAAVRVGGWVKSQDAYERPNEDATWRRALAIVNDRELAAVSIDDITLADEILHRWHPTVKQQVDGSDLADSYLGKLMAVLKQETLDRRDLALAASAVITYKFAKEREEAQRQSRHVGKEGERPHFGYLKLLSVGGYEGRHGWTGIWKFADQNGNRVTYFSGTHTFEKGRVYAGKATITRHSEYNGIKETLISRAKFAPLRICPTCNLSYEGDSLEATCTCVIVDDDLGFQPGEFDIIISG